MDFSIATDFLNTLLKSIDFSWITNIEYIKYLQYIPLFCIGMISSLILTPLIGQWAIKHDVTYKPGVKRVNKDFDNPMKALHEGITPALGGLAVTIPIFIALILFFKLNAFTIPIIVAMAILLIGSTLDDIFNLPAKVQLGYQILATLIIVFSVINLQNLSFFNINLSAYVWNFSALGISQSLSLPGDLILFAWILVCINAVKWTAGSPGIVEANSFIIFSLIFVIAIRYTSLFSATLSIIAAGALAIFLIFALPPQKIMSGSSGKTLYGFLICILAFIADAKISTTIMLLLVPLIDFIYVIVKRIIVYKPKNIKDLLKINDTSHLHHQLLKLNLSRKQVVLVEMTITLFMGSFAILSTGAIRYFALIFGSAIGIAFIVGINIRASKKKTEEKKEESPESKYSY